MRLLRLLFVCFVPFVVPLRAAQLIKDAALSGNTTITGNLTVPEAVRVPTAVGNTGKTITSNGTTWIASTPSSGDGLPTMSGQSGKFLTNNGTTANWADITGGGNVIGSSLASTAITVGAGSSTIQASPTYAFATSTIATLGDSLTQAGTYQTRLLTLLGSDYYCLNLGISRDTTTNMAARFANAVPNRGSNIKYVVIWGGINDVVAGASAATIEANLQAMYTAASSAGKTVIAINITPFKGSSDWSAPRQAVVDAVNTWLATTATGVTHKIDAYTLFEDGSSPDYLAASYNSGDGLHINQTGGNALGDLIHVTVGTWSASSTLDPRLRLGSEARNLIARAGESHLVSDAYWLFTNTLDAAGLGDAGTIFAGGTSTQKSAIIGGNLTVRTNISGGNNITAAGTLSGVAATISGATTSNTITSNGTITAGAAFTSNVTSGGTVLTATAASTVYKALRLANTAGDLYFGIEGATPGAFFPSAAAYESVIYSPTNPVFVSTSLLRASTALSAGTTITAGGQVQGTNYVATGTQGVFVSTGTSTAARTIRLANTGGDMYLGVESSSAGGFFTGSGAYNTVLYSPTNPVYIRTTGISTNGNFTASGTLAGSNLSGTNTGDQTITLSGDVSGSGTGAITATLGTVNSNVGTFGNSTTVPSVTVNGKGLVTAASNATISIPATAISDSTAAGRTLLTAANAAAQKTALSLAASDVGLGSVENTALSTWGGSTNIVTLGNVTSGTWSGTTIGVAKGGTGAITLTSGAVLTGNGTGAIGGISPGTSGNVLTSNGTAWTSAAPAGGGNVTGGTLTANAVIVGASGTGIAALASLGNSGAALLSAGAGSPPAFGALNLAGGSNIITGTLPVGAGGTGATSYTSGQLLIGNTTSGGLDKATLTAGTGITVTNGAGSITVTQKFPETVEVTANTTLTTSHLHTWVDANHATTNITLSVNTGVFAAGDLIYVRQKGAAKVLIAGNATISKPTSRSAETNEQNSHIGIRMIDSSTAVLFGDLK